MLRWERPGASRGSAQTRQREHLRTHELVRGEQRLVAVA